MRKKYVLALLFMMVLLLCTSCGVELEKKEEAVLEGLSIFLEGQEISALYDDGTYLWVGGKDGILLLDRSSGELNKQLDAQIEMVYASGICRTADGLVWAGHSSGITAFNEEGEELFSFGEPQIPGGRVNTLMAYEDGLWIGTMEGAAYLEPEQGNWKVKEILTSENGLSDDCVNVILRVKEQLWFGTYLAAGKGGCSIRKHDGEWEYLSIDEGLPHRYVNAILPISEQELLIATGHLNLGGLARVRLQDEREWIVTDIWNREDGIPGDKVRWLFLDQEQRLWITTESNGILLCPQLDYLQSPIVSSLVTTEKNGLSDNEIKVIAECEDCIWLGSRTGLTRADKSYVDQWFENYITDNENN